MSRTLAEQETTFRWDEEERVCWAATTCPRVATRWRRARFPVVCIGRERDGAECSWEVKLPWKGSKRLWTRLVSLGISGWSVATRPAEGTTAQDCPADDAEP